MLPTGSSTLRSTRVTGRARRPMTPPSWPSSNVRYVSCAGQMRPVLHGQYLVPPRLGSSQGLGRGVSFRPSPEGQFSGVADTTHGRRRMRKCSSRGRSAPRCLASDSGPPPPNRARATSAVWGPAGPPDSAARTEQPSLAQRTPRSQRTTRPGRHRWTRHVSRGDWWCAADEDHVARHARRSTADRCRWRSAGARRPARRRRRQHPAGGRVRRRPRHASAHERARSWWTSRGRAVVTGARRR
jgi:hypothetical protein